MWRQTEEPHSYLLFSIGELVMPYMEMQVLMMEIQVLIIFTTTARTHFTPTILAGNSLSNAQFLRRKLQYTIHNVHNDKPNHVCM